jgi:hypothetical protein
LGGGAQIIHSGAVTTVTAQMGDSTSCRICGLSREMLWDHPELQGRFVQLRYADPPGPPQQAWFCHAHARLGLKYAGMPAWLAWQAVVREPSHRLSGPQGRCNSGRSGHQ